MKIATIGGGSSYTPEIIEGFINKKLSGELPVAERGLVQLQKAFEELTVEAAANHDYEAALQALTINPLVRDGSVAKTVLDELLEAHREYITLK